jgi:hypothetical protein
VHYKIIQQGQDQRGRELNGIRRELELLRVDKSREEQGVTG